MPHDVRRNLAKITHRIHADAIKTTLIPETLTEEQANHVYAHEPDVLNAAPFGVTARPWRDANPARKGDVRDRVDGTGLRVRRLL